MKFSKPYILLAITGAILLLLSFFPSDRTFDVHVHDTVFIIEKSHLYGSLGFLLLFFWLIYNLVYKIILSRALAWIHIISTVVFFAFLVIMSFAEPSGLPQRHDNYYSFYILLNRVVLVLSIIAVLTQLLLLINILAGLIKKVSGKS